MGAGLSTTAKASGHTHRTLRAPRHLLTLLAICLLARLRIGQGIGVQASNSLTTVSPTPGPIVPMRG